MSVVVPARVNLLVVWMTMFVLASSSSSCRMMCWAFARYNRGSVLSTMAGRHYNLGSSSGSSSGSFGRRHVMATTVGWNHDHHRTFGSNTECRMSVKEEEERRMRKKEGPTPITLLAGFLGAGKTSTLKHLLENKEGVKIGVVVNDVASINIDNKLIAGMGAGETVELQNGCACCSLADELIDSILKVTENGKRSYDAIVVELSGVADPVAVQNNWVQATQMGHPATRVAKVERVVTLVDSCTFGTDWMTWDTSGDREGWVPDGECGSQRKVPELLAEQVEAADLLLINKIDLASAEEVQVASSVAKSLNDKAEIAQVKFGIISPQQILGNTLQPPPQEESHSHSHSHNHHQEEEEEEEKDCTDPTCTDSSHDHSHSHSHDHHHQDGASACNDPTCTDASHDHSHSHDHHDDGASACEDPTCTDPTHDHSHSHDHDDTRITNLGITNFVYKSTTPFNSRRLLVLLNNWPVPIKDELDLGQLAEAATDGISGDKGKSSSPFTGVLRSKGFCWLAPTSWTGLVEDSWRHDTAMYWSHAGKHFGIETAGKWWGSITKDKMKDYFVDNQAEYDRILKEDFKSDEWGDRRQELVFIGIGLDEQKITQALDQCLCTEEEMKEYRASANQLKDGVIDT